MSRDPLPNPNVFNSFDDDLLDSYREVAPMYVRLLTFALWPLIALIVVLMVAAIMVVAWPIVLTKRFHITRPNKWSAR